MVGWVVSSVMPPLPWSISAGEPPGRGWTVGLVGASSCQHGAGRLPQDLQIPPQRPRRRVRVVELLELGEGEIVASRHLPIAGHSGSDVLPAGSPPAEGGRLLRRQRPRSATAHLSPHHVY